VTVWLRNFAHDILNWAEKDFRVWPLRFILEVVAWATSIACSLIMAFTLPHPPFLLLYPMFIVQCGIFAWAAWTRQSLGMLGNYILLISIDIAALIRLITL
jgi:hypothetical protein